VAWPLLPGVALYSVAHGSLLFAGGRGGAGEFAFVVGGASAAWAAVCAAVALAVRRWARA
jgi:hypothetical protein